MVSHALLLPLLFSTGLVAGTVDAIAGGGGLIAVPMLLSVGVPPHLALGTNKLQTSVGTAMAAYSYHRRGLFDSRKLFSGLAWTFLGAVLGALTVQVIDSAALMKIIPAVLLTVLLYTLLSPRLGTIDHTPKMNEASFYMIFGTALGFYDGFLGPGVGSLWLFMLVFFLGHNMIRANAYTKVFNLNTNIIALVCFACCHHVDYKIGCCMAAGQLFGGRLGAHLAITKGSGLIRPLFISVVSVTVLTLICKNYPMNPERILLLMAAVSSLMLVYFWKMRKQVGNE